MTSLGATRVWDVLPDLAVERRPDAACRWSVAKSAEALSGLARASKMMLTVP